MNTSNDTSGTASEPALACRTIVCSSGAKELRVSMRTHSAYPVNRPTMSKSPATQMREIEEKHKLIWKRCKQLELDLSSATRKLDLRTTGLRKKEEYVQELTNLVSNRDDHVERLKDENVNRTELKSLRKRVINQRKQLKLFQLIYDNVCWANTSLGNRVRRADENTALAIRSRPTLSFGSILLGALLAYGSAFAFIKMGWLS